MDFRICQTSTASPAEPGGLPLTLEEMMDEYIHLRQKAHDVFELRYQESIDPDKDRWELCSKVLARRDVVDRFSAPW